MSRLVLKIGGSVSRDAATHVLGLLTADRELVVVHGAGPQISAAMRRRGLSVEFVGGRRVTTPEALAVVRECLVAVNTELCAALGVRAVGLVGDEIGMRAKPVPELGLVGDPLPSRPSSIEDALARGLVPVVAPIAAGPLNVNADEAAAALAVGLGAERLLFVTDVAGVLLEGSVLPAIDARDAEGLLAGGVLEGGIVPKLRAAVTAARLGVAAEIGTTAVVA